MCVTTGAKARPSASTTCSGRQVVTSSTRVFCRFSQTPFCAGNTMDMKAINEFRKTWSCAACRGSASQAGLLSSFAGRLKLCIVGVRAFHGAAGYLFARL